MDDSNTQLRIKNSISIKLKQGDVIEGGLLRLEPAGGVFECYSTDPVPEAGESVYDVQIKLAEAVRYSGPIRIEQVVDAGLNCFCQFSVQGDLGGEWTQGGIDADLQAGRLSCAFDRWRTSRRLLPQYKLLIGDMATLFKGVSEWLLSEEHRLRCEPAGEQDVLHAAARELGPSIAGALDSVWEEFHTIADRISVGESDCYRDYLRDHLLEFLMVAPFARRAYTKPLGYAGDYECVNMIERDPYEGRSLFAKMVNYWLLQQLPSKAHRSRIDYLEQRLVDEVARVGSQGRALRVFNLGCGPAIEIQRFLKVHEASSNTEFTLLDFSKETLDYTGRVLGDLKRRHGRRAKLQCIESNVRRLLRRTNGSSRGLGARYDLIYCAGLFDYLPDPVCAQLLDLLHEWLDPGGLLLSTNVKTTRAIELSLDYMLDWKLICRDQPQFESLVPEGAEGDFVKTVGVDQGYNLFLEIRKAED